MDVLYQLSLRPSGVLTLMGALGRTPERDVEHSSSTLPLRLQVYQQYLLRARMHINSIYFGLFEAPEYKIGIDFGWHGADFG